MILEICRADRSDRASLGSYDPILLLSRLSSFIIKWINKWSLVCYTLRITNREIIVPLWDLWLLGSWLCLDYQPISYVYMCHIVWKFCEFQFLKISWFLLNLYFVWIKFFYKCMCLTTRLYGMLSLADLPSYLFSYHFIVNFQI